MAKIIHIVERQPPSPTEQRAEWLNSIGRYINKTNTNEWNGHPPLSLFCLNVNASYKFYPGHGKYVVEYIFEKKDHPFEVFHSELETLKHMNGFGGIEYDMPIM